MPAETRHAGEASIGPALRDAKRSLRNRVLAARDALPPPERDAAAAAIARAILALPSYAAAPTVCLTLPFGSEWDTTPIARAALSAGKSVALPRVDTATRMLDLHTIRDPDADVVIGYRGIPEPRVTCPRQDPAAVAWVLVPGVAFDPAGRRLGYGGGFYDRLLPLMLAGTPRIVGAFDQQIVAQVPAAAHDMTVDAIVTESRLIVTARAA